MCFSPTGVSKATSSKLAARDVKGSVFIRFKMDGEEAEVTDLKYLRSHPDENKLTSFEQLKVGDDVIAYHSRNMIKYEAVVISRLTPTGIKKIAF